VLTSVSPESISGNASSQDRWFTVRAYIFRCECMRVCVGTCMCVHIYLRVSAHVCVFVVVCFMVHMHVYMPRYTYIDTRKCVYIYTCVYIYSCVYLHMCVYIYRNSVSTCVHVDKYVRYGHSHKYSVSHIDILVMSHVDMYESLHALFS